MSKTNKSYWKIILVFLAVISIFAGVLVRRWQDTRNEREQIKQVNKAIGEYIDIYRKDTYGGKTPQETLDLFVKALEGNDIELASKYFMPDDTGSRKEWEDALVDARNAGRLERTTDLVRRAKASGDSIDPNHFATFITRDSSGEIEAYIEIVFNGNVWKIDSL